MKRHLLCLAGLLSVLATGAQAETNAAPAVKEAKSPVYTLDTPIEVLVADAKAKAVLDKELPGLTTHAQYDVFKGMSLKALQPMSGGQITDEHLKAVETALKALPAS